MQRRLFLTLGLTALALSACEDNNEPSSSAPYLGLTEGDAIVRAEAESVMFRVVERDGQPLPATRDYRPGRINAVVENGVVVRYAIEGADEEYVLTQ